MNKKEWTEVHNPFTNDKHNACLEINDNQYVSYLYPNSNISFGNSDKPEVGETALVTRSPWKCLILNGDHRRDYEEVIDNGYDACYKLYESKKAEHGSSWSD